MTTNTTASTVTESELFQQFRATEEIIYRDSRTGRVCHSAPVKDYLWGFDNSAIDEAIDASCDNEEYICDDLENLAREFKGAAENIELVLRQFDDFKSARIIPLPDDAPEDMPQLYRPLDNNESPDPTEAEIHTDTLTEDGAGFVRPTCADLENMRSN